MPNEICAAALVAKLILASVSSGGVVGTWVSAGSGCCLKSLTKEGPQILRRYFVLRTVRDVPAKRKYLRTEMSSL